MSYIEREAALKAITEHPSNIAPFTRKAIDAIKNIPTADVVEVRHGEWLLPLTDEPWRIGYFCRCSVCNKINRGHTLSIPSFCENCGAKMDGERKEK